MELLERERLDMELLERETGGVSYCCCGRNCSWTTGESYDCCMCCRIVAVIAASKVGLILSIDHCVDVEVKQNENIIVK